MPKLLMGESPEEARRREQGLEPLAEPLEAPSPAPVETAPSQVDVSQARQAISRPPPSKEGLYAPVPKVLSPEERFREYEREHPPPTPEQRHAQRTEEARQRFRTVEARQTKWASFWESYPGWAPENPAEELEKNVPELIGQWDHVFASNAPPGAGPSAPLHGSAEDVFDSGTVIYSVLKNMETLQAHLETSLPESYAELLGAAESGGPLSVAIDPTKAVVAAVDSIAKAHPDDYTAYMATEEGMEDLYVQSVLALMTPPMPWEGTGVTGFLANVNDAYREVSPGVHVGEWLHSQLPEGRWTDVLVEAVELAGDPIFLATIAVLPPAGLASKARLVAEISGGMAVGEEAAEAAGVPPLVGALGGGLALPAATRVLQGITRAGLGIALESAGRNPVRGQPATELRVSKGVGPSTVDDMEVAFGEALPRPKVYYYAVRTADKGKGIPSDAVLTPVRAEADADAVGLLGKAEVVAVTAEEGAVAPMTALPKRRSPMQLAEAYEARTGREADLDTLIPQVRVPEDLPIEVIDVPAITTERVAERAASRVAQGLPPEPEMTARALGLEYAKTVGRWDFVTKGGVRVQFVQTENTLKVSMAREAGEASIADMQEVGRIINRMARANPEYRIWQVPASTRLRDIYMRTGKGAWQEGAEGLGGELELGGILPSRRGPMQVVNPKGVKPIPEKAVPALAGGEDVWSIELNDTMLRAVAERPEARDILRKAAEGLAHTVPGARRIVEVVNRMALMEESHLKAAIGWQLGKAWQDAQREVALAALRGKSLPFRENAIGQIWLPKVAGQAKPRFGRGEGDWIAIGDVFESVMRGESTYLPRLAEGQVSWIKDAQRIMAPFTRETEAAMGIKVATREVHWPRFTMDPTAGRWTVHAGQGRARPPAMFRRIFEVQEEAISEFGIRYKPGAVTQMDLYIQGMQRMSRDAVMGRYLRRAGLQRVSPRSAQRETFAELLGPAVPKWTATGPRREVINKELMADIQTLIGPTSRNPMITVPQKLNAVARLMLTGSMDTGVGSLQMATLAFAFPEIWAESMARGLYAMIADPKSIYRFLSASPAARRFAQYGGNVGLDSEFFEATRLVGQAIPRVPGAQPVLDVASYPLRLLIRRMQVGFEGPLLFGRVLAFDAMADAAAGVRQPVVAGVRERLGGARAPTQPSTMAGRATLRAAGGPGALEGQALHEEMFRLARFTDTLLGQPKLGGIVSTRQAQFESAWVWFATRYTRSILGTFSYAAGTGYTPAQTRIILAKMFVGGAAVLSGLIAGRGVMEGKSQDEIIKEIMVALNPMSGKKHMSMEIGKSWYGLGGAYRSGMSAFAGLFDKKNWNVDEWGDPTPGGLHAPTGLWDNPIIRPLRSRTAPMTGTLSDFIEGEDFLGYSVDIGEFVDDPRKLGEYAVDSFAPITVDAFLQGEGDWQRRLPAAIAEFFGLRTSPETAFESLQPVRNRVSQDLYGVDFDDKSLEHNRVARQRINDHPDVVAVLEGRVRPIQDKRVQTAWDKYFRQADGVREDYGVQKEDLDEIVRSGRMDGRTYRDNYGDIQLEEFGELTGLQKALGLAFEDREPPEGTVDAALQAYYAVDLEGKDEDGNFIYRDPETGEYDWEAWYSDREDTLTGLSEEERADVDWYFRRHETELRRNFRAAFDDIIEPSGYLRTRETVAESLGVDLDALKEITVRSIEERGLRAAPGDVWRIVDKVLNGQLEARLGEDAPTLSDLRVALRKVDPRLDVELYRQGFTTTVRTAEAVEITEDLKQRHPERAYFTPRLADDAEEGAVAKPFTTQVKSSLTFLKAGRATHPDEGEVQEEYDLMMGALETGENISEAKGMAQSHLAAHQNALRPEMRGTDRDPYPDEPEKNQAAVDGFTKVISLLSQKEHGFAPVEEGTQRPKVPSSAEFRLPEPTQGGLDGLFEEATRGGGVSAKIIENVYRGAEGYRDHPERGVDPDKFITHELVERLLIDRGIPQPKAHAWVAEAEGRPSGGPIGPQGG